jgi:hypothetical protein
MISTQEPFRYAEFDWRRERIRFCSQLLSSVRRLAGSAAWPASRRMLGQLRGRFTYSTKHHQWVHCLEVCDD